MLRSHGGDVPVAAGASCRGSGLGRPPWTRETLYWGGIGGLADISEDGFDIIMSNLDYLYFGQSFSFSSSLFCFASSSYNSCSPYSQDFPYEVNPEERGATPCDDQDCRDRGSAGPVCVGVDRRQGPVLS